MKPAMECYLRGKPDRHGVYVDCEPIDEEDYCHGCKVFICEAHDGPPDQVPIGPHQPLDHIFTRHLSAVEEA